MVRSDGGGPIPVPTSTWSLLAALLSALLTACVLVPEPTAPSESSHQPGAIMSVSGQIDSGNGSLAYVETKPEEPAFFLVAVHGGPGMTSEYMRDLDILAQDGAAVIRYDQRGNGGSSMPSPSLSLAAHIEDLDAMIGGTGAGPVILFGHSWGGLLSLAYAAAHPQRVLAVVLFGSAPPTRSALRLASFQFERRIAAGQRAGWIAPDLPSVLSSLTPILPAYFSDPAFQPPAELRDVDVSPQVNSGTWEALGEYDLRPILATIEAPVLFFYGADDPFGRSMGAATLDALTGTVPEVHWLPDCGHFWQECPEQFMPPLRAFLARIARREG